MMAKQDNERLAQIRRLREELPPQHGPLGMLRDDGWRTSDIDVLLAEIARLQERLVWAEATISTYPKTVEEMDRMERDAFLRGRACGEKYGPQSPPAPSGSAMQRARKLLDRMCIDWNEQDDDCAILAAEFTEAEQAARREGRAEGWAAGYDAAAGIADEYAEVNIEMAGDSILADPVLSGKSRSPDAFAKSAELGIEGCIHSSMYHAAKNIAAEIRARALANRDPQTGSGGE